MLLNCSILCPNASRCIATMSLVLQLELDQEQNQNEELEAQVAQLTESIDLEKCERKSIEVRAC